MANKDLVRLAVDAYKGHVAGNYSVDDSMEVLRQALIEANGGSTKLDYRAIRDGKCNGLFAIVEEIITKTVIEGLPESCPLFNYVDFRNIAEGDTNVFEIRDNGLFVVADIADGTQGLRRQRLAGGEEITEAIAQEMVLDGAIAPRAAGESPVGVLLSIVIAKQEAFLEVAIHELCVSVQLHNIGLAFNINEVTNL